MRSVLDLSKIRPRFPALTPGVVHADAPGGTQAVDVAIEAMAEHLRQGTANQHGVFATSERVDALCADARWATAAFTGGDPDGIVFGPNMTTLTFHLARAVARELEEGDELVCTRLDHDANVTPWVRAAEASGATVRWVELDPASGTLCVDELPDVVTERTRVIAFPRASNALGTLVDPSPFVAAARDVGAWTFMDAVHAAPHVPLERASDGVDVVACSPYKFFGPHAGVLSGDPRLLARLSPDKVRPAPDAGPERWQTGTASFEAIAGTAAAIGYLDELGMDAIGAHETELTGRFLAGLDDLGHVTLHGPTATGQRTPTFAVTVDGHAPEAVAARLAARGIHVWHGHYYAVEPMLALGLLERGGAVRIGFVHYHGPDDVDRVLHALAELA